MIKRKFNHTVCSDSVVVCLDGAVTTVARGAANFEELARACRAGDEDAVRKHLSPSRSMKTWLHRDALGSAFAVTPAGELLHDGRPVDAGLARRAKAMAAAGLDPRPLLRFWQRLRRNPSWRSATQLFGFLQHAGIPICDDGTFLAYKGVRRDLFDGHTGKTFKNEPGAAFSLPRGDVSDDFDVACSVGLHVGSEQYAVGYARSERDCGPGGRVVICRVDPADVVCVPKDCSMQKVRCCRYVVVGFHGAQLDSLVHCEAAVDEVDDVDEVEHVTDATATLYGSAVAPPDFRATWRERRAAELGAALHLDAGAARLLSLSTAQLMLQPQPKLVRLAARLRVVGASRLPGGRAALVGKICEVRGF